MASCSLHVPWPSGTVRSSRPQSERARLSSETANRHHSSTISIIVDLVKRGVLILVGEIQRSIIIIIIIIIITVSPG